MSRTLSQRGLGSARTLNGLSNTFDNEQDIDNIKTKYDFDSTVNTGNLLIGNSAANYTTNRLTAGNNITITNGDGTISIASTQLGVSAGTNLNKTTDINGDITLNLNAVIGGMTSINAFTLVSNISSAANQFLLKDNSVGGFGNGTFLTANASGLIVPTTQATINTAVQATVLGGTNISKTGPNINGDITLNLDSNIGGINLINSYNPNLSTLNSVADQFLLKTTVAGAFSTGDILTVDSNGLIVPTTQATINTAVQGTILGGTNITKTSAGGDITLNLDAVITGLTSLDGSGDLLLKRAGITKVELEQFRTRFYPNSATLGGNLLLNCGLGGQTNNVDYELLQDYLSSGFRTDKIDCGVRLRRKLSSGAFDQFFVGHQQSEGQCVILNPNNDTHFIFRSSQLKISKPDESALNFSITLGNSASNFTMTSLESATFDCDTFKICKSRMVAIRNSNDLYLFNGASLPTTIASNNDFLRQSGDGSLLQLRGNVISFVKANELFRIDNETLTTSKNKMLIQPISASQYGDTDFMLDINSFSSSTSSDCKSCKVAIRADLNNANEDAVPSLHFFSDGNSNEAIIGLDNDNDTLGNNNMYFHYPSSDPALNKFSFYNGNIGTNRDRDITYRRLQITANETILGESYGDARQGGRLVFDKSGNNATSQFVMVNEEFTSGNETIFKLHRIQNGGGGGVDRDFLKIGDFNGTDAIKLLVGGSNIINVFGGQVDINKKIFTNSNEIFFKLGNNSNYFLQYVNGSGGESIDSIKVIGQLRLGEESSGNGGSLNMNGFYGGQINLRKGGDNNQIIKWRSANETNSTTSSDNVDGPLIKGWNGGRLSSQRGGSGEATHAFWFKANDGTGRFGGNAGYVITSDDRVKHNETPITNGIETINKLNPVFYKKSQSVEDTSLLVDESGYIAQDVYNNIPELRHLVNFDKSLTRNFVDGDLNGDCIEDIYSKTIDQEGKIIEKATLCSLSYTELLPYHTKAIQELYKLVNAQATLISNLELKINTN